MEKHGNNHKTKFKFDSTCLDYEIQLKPVSYKWLWWLLIPIILLLLLIPFEKDLNVKVESEDGNSIENAEVQFEYNPMFLYRSGELFPVQRFFSVQKSNAQGHIRYENIKYSMFTVVFQCLSRISIQSIANGYKLKSMNPYFHLLMNNDTIYVRMEEIRYTSLKFRTIDGFDHSLLKEVSLKVSIDGKLVDNIKNSGNGEFELSAPDESTITIIAEKLGYQTNNTISNVIVNELSKADQTMRDLIMELPPCSASGDDNTQSEGGSVKEYDMKRDRGVFQFEYDTDSEPDHIIIYDARAKDRGRDNILFDKNIGTSGFKSEELVFTSRIITVEVIGTTRWTYTVNCPEE